MEGGPLPPHRTIIAHLCNLAPAPVVRPSLFCPSSCGKLILPFLAAAALMCVMFFTSGSRPVGLCLAWWVCSATARVDSLSSGKRRHSAKFRVQSTECLCREGRLGEINHDNHHNCDGFSAVVRQVTKIINRVSVLGAPQLGSQLGPHAETAWESCLAHPLRNSGAPKAGGKIGATRRPKGSSHGSCFPSCQRHQGLCMKILLMWHHSTHCMQWLSMQSTAQGAWDGEPSPCLSHVRPSVRACKVNLLLCHYDVRSKRAPWARFRLGGAAPVIAKRCQGEPPLKVGSAIISRLLAATITVVRQ